MEYPAAGCTSSAKRKNPDDFSSWFFSAFEGKLASGEALPTVPDFDSDGQVSFQEAVALVRIHDGSIDMPILTSELFLRALPFRTALTIPELQGPNGLDQPLETLLRTARPEQKGAVLALSKSLQLASERAPALTARREANRMAAERRTLDGQLPALTKTQSTARAALQKALNLRWPWLSNGFHPLFQVTLEREGVPLEDFLKNSPEAMAFKSADGEVSRVRSSVARLTRELSRYERLAWLSESVVLEAHVRKAGTPALLQKWEQLVACERGTF